MEFGAVVRDGRNVWCFETKRIAVKDRNAYKVELFGESSKYIVEIHVKLPGFLEMVRVLSKVVRVRRLEKTQVLHDLKVSRSMMLFDVKGGMKAQLQCLGGGTSCVWSELGGWSWAPGTSRAHLTRLYCLNNAKRTTGYRSHSLTLSVHGHSSRGIRRSLQALQGVFLRERIFAGQLLDGARVGLRYGIPPSPATHFWCAPWESYISYILSHILVQHTTD